MRAFQLHRDEDVSGVSGTGVVAEGFVFWDGVTVLRWYGDNPSTVVWPSLDAAMTVHGHDGRTRIVDIDDLLSEAPRALDLVDGG